MKTSYVAERDDELNLQKGDVLLVFEKGGDGWWRGMIGERKGWFPADILQGCMFVRQLSHHIQSFAVTLELGHFLCFYGRYSGNSRVFLSC